MGIEQFAVGFLICLVLNVIFWIIATCVSWISNDSEGAKGIEALEERNERD